MTVRRKTLAIVALTCIGLMAVLCGVARKVILGNALRGEQISGQRNVNRVLIALDEELASMDRFTMDRSAWDATYDFMAHPVGQFRYYFFGGNARGTQGTRRLMSVIMLNNRGEIVAERGNDLPNGAPMKIPDSLKSHLVPTDVLLQHPNTKQGVSGIVMLPEGPLLVTSRPILKTNGDVPPPRCFNRSAVLRIVRPGETAKRQQFGRKGGTGRQT